MDQTNQFPLLCPNKTCGCLILKPGKAKHVELEPADQITIPCVTSHENPLQVQQVKAVWRVTGDMYQFENIGFSKIPPPAGHPLPSKGDFRYLCCASCEAGPLGYGFLCASPQTFCLATDRVVEEK